MAVINKFNILGVGISAADMGAVCGFISDIIREKRKAYVCTCPVNTIIECRRNSQALKSINSADLVTADGMPVFWVGRLKGFKDAGKVSGSDLMQELCRISRERGFKHYLYGSTPQVLSRLKEKLTAQFPGLLISGMHSPVFKQGNITEDDLTIDMLNRSASDILWVGLGSPKQDIWAARHRARLNIPAIIAVGAAFDFLSGTKKRAPRWMQLFGLEWFFRLSQEPGRLWKRYLINNFIFISLISWELFAGLFKRSDK